MIDAPTRAAAVPDRPALAPWYRLVEAGDRMLLEHGATVVTFEGRAARTLLPRLVRLLDGTRTVAEIERELGTSIAPAIEKALALLVANDVLVEGPQPSVDDDPVAAAATFAAAATRRTDTLTARKVLAGARVAVLGSGLNAETIVGELEKTGIGHVERLSHAAGTDTGSFVIAAPDRHEVAELALLNRARLGSDAAWLQVLPYDGRFVVVGPLFVPHRSACRDCYVLRRAACSGYEDDFDRLDAEPIRAASPPALATVTAGLAAVLALRWLTVEDPRLPGRFYALETGSILELSYHNVLRVPRCPSCGVPPTAVPSPWFERAA